MEVSLETKIAGITLRNPTILAAGILGSTGKSLKKVAQAGAGAVTTKSISLEPRKGHKNPTVLQLEDGIINAVGLSNPGVDNFLEEIEVAKQGNVPVIANVVGSKIEDYVKVVEKLGNLPDMIELNISCPNVQTGMAFGKDPKSASELTKKVKEVSQVPVIVKLTPNADKLIEVAKEVENAGADCISAVNTLGPGMVIDVETATPVLSNKVGGISGNLIKPIALRCVYKIASSVKLPIIGIGGISSGNDAAAMLMVGASAVGIGSAIEQYGLEVFKKVCKELEEFMIRKKYKSTKTLKGLASRG